jgi:hypothetical protein
MDFKGMTPRLEYEIGVLILVEKTNGLDYAFTRVEDIVLIVKAHHCLKQEFSIGESKETITKKNSFPFPLPKKNKLVEYAHHSTLFILGYLPLSMVSQLDIE